MRPTASWPGAAVSTGRSTAVGGRRSWRRPIAAIRTAVRQAAAVITGAGELSARYVIHTVGPVWSGGRRGEADLLASAYRSCLELALDHGCGSIAFPSLSTGVYRYPIDEAARIALDVAKEFLAEKGAPALVRFVLFNEGAYGAFAAAMEEIVKE